MSTQAIIEPLDHLDCISATSNPTGAYNIYAIDATNDGTNAPRVMPVALALAISR
jgi:hypothetical protein